MDSDTKFEPDSIRYLHDTLESDSHLAGVCGKLTLSNLGIGTFKEGCTTAVFYLSTIFIVGYQFYEYHYNQILGKRKKKKPID